jgi:hypothetical protein
VTSRSGRDEEALAHLAEGGLGNWIRSYLGRPLPERRCCPHAHMLASLWQADMLSCAVSEADPSGA